MKRSKRYQEAKKLIKDKAYNLDEALDLVKKTSKVKFDASVEVHFHLGIDPTRSEQQVRGSVLLPFITGKEKKIAVFAQGNKAKQALQAGASIVGGEELIQKILKTGKCDFNIAITTPDLMPKLARLGKILGPKGLMPNPKTETITSDPAKVVKELKFGKVNFKVDVSGIIHQVIGKVSFENKKLKENFKALLEAIKKARPPKITGEYIKKVTICSTMGPGIRIKV